MLNKPDEGNIEKILLKAHRQGVKRARELSERTGVPLVIEVKGKIKRIKPKYKYIRVPIKSNTAKQNPPRKSD